MTWPRMRAEEMIGTAIVFQVLGLCAHYGWTPCILWLSPNGAPGDLDNLVMLVAMCSGAVFHVGGVQVAQF